jgi:hypothetical protein
MTPSSLYYPILLPISATVSHCIVVWCDSERSCAATSDVSSPKSILSWIDLDHVREKAEQLLEVFVSIISGSTDCYTRVSIALPVTRVYLLLLGDSPSPFVAKQVLDLIAISLNRSKSFNRKFELVSGWTILKTVLPHVWDADIHSAVFGILLDQTQDQGPVVTCSYILPAILNSLTRMLVTVAQDSPPQNIEANENGVCCDTFGG